MHKKIIEPADYISYFSINQDSFWHSPAEKKVYDILKNMIDEHYTILPHVTFTDVFNIKDDNEITGELRNIVSNYHFDFVIYDSNDLPVLFIEINGSSHTSANKTKIDNFKKKLLSNNTNLNLISMDFFERLSDEEFEAKVKNTLKLLVDSRRKYRAYCPICKHALTYRHTKDGNAAFYFCSNCFNSNGTKKNRTFNEDDIPYIFK